MYNQIQTKENYDILLKSGMFWEFHPELSGEWEKDKEIIHHGKSYSEETERKNLLELGAGHNLIRNLNKIIIRNLIDELGDLSYSLAENMGSYDLEGRKATRDAIVKIEERIINLKEQL